MKISSTAPFQNFITVERDARLILSLPFYPCAETLSFLLPNLFKALK
jgi:hypothetical protein